MGHASTVMTLRYQKHAPEAFISEDGAAIIDSMTATTPRARPGRRLCGRVCGRREHTETHPRIHPSAFDA
jgi:hypothetical protein